MYLLSSCCIVNHFCCYRGVIRDKVRDRSGGMGRFKDGFKGWVSCVITDVIT